MKPPTEQDIKKYIKLQATRIGLHYNVELTEMDLKRIYSFYSEHLQDSHQLCDLIETVAVAAKYIEELEDE